jgi:hypothetical protein
LVSATMPLPVTVTRSRYLPRGWGARRSTAQRRRLCRERAACCLLQAAAPATAAATPAAGRGAVAASPASAFAPVRVQPAAAPPHAPAADLQPPVRVVAHLHASELKGQRLLGDGRQISRRRELAHCAGRFVADLGRWVAAARLAWARARRHPCPLPPPALWYSEMKRRGTTATRRPLEGRLPACTHHVRGRPAARPAPSCRFTTPRPRHSSLRPAAPHPAAGTPRADGACAPSEMKSWYVPRSEASSIWPMSCTLTPLCSTRFVVSGVMRTWAGARARCAGRSARRPLRPLRRGPVAMASGHAAGVRALRAASAPAPGL